VGRAEGHPCLERLDDLGVEYQTVRRPKIDLAVRVIGPIGGVIYEGYQAEPLILDCSLVYSLAEAGRFFRAAGVTRVTYSSAYQIRNIRGTNRPSKHSYGLAIDVHRLEADSLGELRVADDYEQGLGDNVDCVGRPLTAKGGLLRLLACQLQRSTLFRLILDPDYDGGHYNHFHIEALPWAARPDFAVTRNAR
jgi:hypothetical protein